MTTDAAAVDAELAALFDAARAVFAEQACLHPIAFVVARAAGEVLAVEVGDDVGGADMLDDVLTRLAAAAARHPPRAVLLFAEIWHRRRVAGEAAPARPLAEDPNSEEAVMCCARSRAWPERERVWFAAIRRGVLGAPTLDPFERTRDTVAETMRGRIWDALRAALPDDASN